MTIIKYTPLKIIIKIKSLYGAAASCKKKKQQKTKNNKKQHHAPIYHIS